MASLGPRRLLLGRMSHRGSTTADVWSRRLAHSCQGSVQTCSSLASGWCDTSWPVSSVTLLPAPHSPMRLPCTVSCASRAAPRGRRAPPKGGASAPAPAKRASERRVGARSLSRPQRPHMAAASAGGEPRPGGGGSLRWTFPVLCVCVCVPSRKALKASCGRCPPALGSSQTSSRLMTPFRGLVG